MYCCRIAVMYSSKITQWRPQSRVSRARITFFAYVHISRELSSAQKDLEE